MMIFAGGERVEDEKENAPAEALSSNHSDLSFVNGFPT